MNKKIKVCQNLDFKRNSFYDRDILDIPIE